MDLLLYVPLIVLVLMVVRLEWGMALFVIYSFCLPVKSIIIGPLSLPYNLFFIAMFLAAMRLKTGKSWKQRTKPLTPFIWLYMALLLLMPFAGSNQPIVNQFRWWVSDLLPSLAVPFAIWNLYLVDRNRLRVIIWALFMAIVIAIGYGLFVASLGGANPYLSLLLPMVGSEFNEYYAFERDDGRLFGRVSSVFVHPMTFGLFTSLSFWFVFYYFHPADNRKKVVCMSFFLLPITIMTLVSGVRSTIVGVLIGLIIYVYMNKPGAQLKTALLLLFVGLVIMNVNEKLGDYVLSIFNSGAAKDVSGSSLGLRLKQLYGCFNIIESNMLLGMGYRWNNFYQNVYGDHPQVLAFESLLFVVLCSWGIIGVVIWTMFSAKVVTLLRKEFGARSIPIITLFFIYIGYSLVTGEYFYMQYFVIFYILMYCVYYQRNLEI